MRDVAGASGLGVSMHRVRRPGLGRGVVALLVACLVATVVLGAMHRLAGRDRLDDSGPTPMPSASALPAPDLSGPRFPMVTRSPATIAGVDTEVYLPLPGSAGRAAERYPLAVLLRDTEVDASQYEQFAHDLGAYGLAVVVPSRTTSRTVREVIAWATALDAGPPHPAQGLVDPRRVFVVGHGSGALGAAVPAPVRAVAFYAPTTQATRAVGGVPSLVVCGSADPEVARCRSGQASVVTVDGADALSVTDQGRGGVRGQSEIGAERETTIASLAQWTALWLLAHTGDPTAEQFYATAAAAPPSGVQVRLRS